MEKYVELLKEFLGEDRNCNKNVYRICKAIYIAVQKGASEEQISTFISSLGGAR